MRSIPLCRNCENPLIRIHFRAGYYWVCDTVGCSLSRERQGFVPDLTYRSDPGFMFGSHHYAGIPARKGLQ